MSNMPTRPRRRAPLALLYALTGSFDAPGGNVLLPSIPSAPITGEDLPAAKNMSPAIGAAERPLGPARRNSVAVLDFYRAVLEETPYPVRGLIGFGHNMLLAQSDPKRGRAALAALDFYAHADLFMNSTAAMADIVLPIASCFEREALKIGFEISAEAQSLVQLRPAVVPPPGAARSDTDIVFDLAGRLGLAEQFFGGSVEAAYRQQLQPSGITLEQLHAEPGRYECRSLQSMRSMANRTRTVSRTAFPRARARSNSGRRFCSSADTRRCPPSSNRKTVRSPSLS